MIEFFILYVYFYIKEEIYSKYFVEEGSIAKIITTGILSAFSTIIFHFTYQKYEDNLLANNIDVNNVYGTFWFLFISVDLFSTFCFLYVMSGHGAGRKSLFQIFDVVRLMLMFGLLWYFLSWGYAIESFF